MPTPARQDLTQCCTRCRVCKLATDTAVMLSRQQKSHSISYHRDMCRVNNVTTVKHVYLCVRVRVRVCAYVCVCLFVGACVYSARVRVSVLHVRACACVSEGEREGGERATEKQRAHVCVFVRM